MDNPIAKVHLDNIQHNIAVIKNTAKKSKILAVIKADAYGHGSLQVAYKLDIDNNVSAFGVSRYYEALELQQAGINKPILIMEGVNKQEHLEQAVLFDWWLVVQSTHQLKLISTLDISKPIKIWLKFNTGMNRLGFKIGQLKEVIEQVNRLIDQDKIKQQYVIMTHFAVAEDTDNNYTEKQLHLFREIYNNELIDKTNIELSAANSAGVFGWPESHFDWVRPGVSIYGSSPFANPDMYRNNLNLKASMSLMAEVINIQTVDKEDYVGYGLKWQAKQNSIIAIINCGYADCYPRLVSDSSHVFINNKKCRIIGNVSMDMLAIDCTDLHQNINIGDAVELWGDNISIDEVAKNYNTIANEIYCRITQRVERVYD